MYFKIYQNLCQQNKIRKPDYGRGSGLHRHRILPGHSGGLYEQDNITYLTCREHVIAHFLLWKIYKNPNDLRSMNMLGANLTLEQRRAVGNWCYENKIGFHKFVGTKYHRKYSERGLENQKKNFEETGNKQNFYYWSIEEGRKERAALGGKKSNKNLKEKGLLPNFLSDDPEIRKKNASKAGSASPKFPVTDGNICKKFHTETERQAFLTENIEFRSGGRPYQRKDKTPGTWVNNGVKNAIVKYNVLDNYLETGWELGRK